MLRNVTRNRGRAWLPALALALAVGACSDSTGPGGEFDPVATNAATSEALVAFDQNPALQSMEVLAWALPSLGGSAPALAPVVEGPSAPSWVEEQLPLFHRIAPFLNPANPAVIFPADFLGKTLIYNPATEQYEIAPDSTGAPANGIWVKLYAVDPIFHSPVIPLDDIGHVELTDESTPAADQLGVVVVLQGVTYLDYTASAVVTTSDVTFTADGFISDGTHVVDFVLSHVWSSTEGLTVDYSLDARNSDALLRLILNVDPQDAVLAITFTIQHDGNTVELDVTATETALSGTITHNSNLVVQISGTPAAPVFTDADNNPLTAEQLEALREIFEAVGAFLDSFDDLLAPAYLVLQVSIIAF
jgi:hypothetical protein